MNIRPEFNRAELAEQNITQALAIIDQTAPNKRQNFPDSLFQAAMDLEPERASKILALKFCAGEVVKHKLTSRSIIANTHPRDPNEPENNPYLHMGHALAALGREEDALNAFTIAAALEPENAAAYHGMGSSLHMLFKNDEALPALQKAIELEPKNYAHHILMVDILTGLERFNEAKLYLNTAYELAEKLGEEQETALAKIRPSRLELAEAQKAKLEIAGQHL